MFARKPSFIDVHVNKEGRGLPNLQDFKTTFFYVPRPAVIEQGPATCGKGGEMFIFK